MTLGQRIRKAMNGSQYWINWEGRKIPLSEINRNYAQNIRALIRRRMKPEEYKGKPLYAALGRIRRNDF